MIRIWGRSVICKCIFESKYKTLVGNQRAAKVQGDMSVVQADTELGGYYHGSVLHDKPLSSKRELETR